MNATCSHGGFRCAKPVTFTVETSVKQGKQPYGPHRGVGFCDECFLKLEESFPGLVGDDQ
jgi:hypothetical protein